MKLFRDNLHDILTARGGRVPFGELYSLVHDVLRTSSQLSTQESMSPRIIVSRWLSEGFIEADIATQMFVLCRPTLSMVTDGRWVLTGAKSTSVELIIQEFLEKINPYFVPAYAPPKRYFKSRSQKITSTEINKILKVGANVIGDAQTPAWRVHLKVCPGLESFLTKPASEMDRRAWLYQYRRWRISTKDFFVSSLPESSAAEATSGAFVCTNPNPKFNEFLFVAVSRSNEVYRFEDWRRLYVWALSEFWESLSPFFYNPNKKTFGVFLLPNFKSRLDNWLPKEISTLLGSCCFNESMIQREIQDVDNINLKSCVIYPEVSLELAEKVHGLLGFKNKHPLRYLFY